MSKKPKLYKFDTIIYPFNIWILVNKNPNIISKYFREYSGNKIVFVKEDNSNRMEAFSMKIISKDKHPTYGALIYFRDRKDMTPEIIVHESSHATKFLFEHIQADIREHEPFEYILEFIVKCCYRVKKSKNKNNEKTKS